MTTEVRADYVDLARLAGEVLGAADGVTDGLKSARDVLSVPAAAFGNSSGGGSVHSAHQQVAASGGDAVENLVEVLEGDVDRIYTVAFAYRKADQDAADRLCRHRRPGPQPC